MIIQVRGTSGSGKTTVMNEVMRKCKCWIKCYRDGRAKPLYYVSKSDKWPKTLVLGHYETPTGGTDTIGSAGKAFDLIQELVEKEKPEVVLYEGLLVSEDTKWATQLEDLRCIFLTTDIDECIKRVKSRRKEAGNDKPLKEDNTRNRVRTIARARTKLLAANVVCKRASTEQASKIIFRWLGVNPTGVK